MGGPGIQVDGGELEWDGSGGCGGKHSSTYGKWGEGFVSWLICGSTNPRHSRKSRVYFTYILPPKHPYQMLVLLYHTTSECLGMESFHWNRILPNWWPIRFHPSLGWNLKEWSLKDVSLTTHVHYMTLLSIHPSIHLSSSTLQGTNISPKNGILKMIFLFPRWDMLIP